MLISTWYTCYQTEKTLMMEPSKVKKTIKIKPNTRDQSSNDVNGYEHVRERKKKINSMKKKTRVNQKKEMKRKTCSKKLSDNEESSEDGNHDTSARKRRKQVTAEKKKTHKKKRKTNKFNTTGTHMINCERKDRTKATKVLEKKTVNMNNKTKENQMMVYERKADSKSDDEVFITNLQNLIFDYQDFFAVDEEDEEQDLNDLEWLEMSERLKWDVEQLIENPENPEHYPHDTILTQDFFDYVEWKTNISKITLRIICKTKMKKGICYIGLDESQNRILRPIITTHPGACCWPKKKSENVEVGSLVVYTVLYHPDKSDNIMIRTAYPHRTDDMLVTDDIDIVPGTEWSPESLIPLSKQHVYEIFPEHMIKKDRYINIDGECASVGILLTKENLVKMYMKKNGDEVKTRVKISNSGLNFDFPVKAIGHDNPDEKGNKECLLILGLGRPFEGYSKKRRFIPPRCYILVTGIMILGK